MSGFGSTFDPAGFAGFCSPEPMEQSGHHRHQAPSYESYTDRGGGGHYHRGLYRDTITELASIEKKTERDPKLCATLCKDDCVAVFCKCPEGIKVSKPTAFNLNPHLHIDDVCSVDDLKDKNGWVTGKNGKDRRAKWMDRCVTDPSKFAAFHTRFPDLPHRSRGVLSHLDFGFTLPSESLKVDSLIKHAEADGSIQMRINSKAVNSGFGVNFGKGPNFIVDEVRILEQYSNLPITYEAIFSASAPHDNGFNTEWSTPVGVHQHGSDAARSGVFHHVIPAGGVGNIKGKTEEKTLFLAKSTYNTPHFSRWIRVNSTKLLHELDDCRSSKDKDYVRITAPPEDIVKAENVLQFIVLNEWIRLYHLSADQNIQIPMVDQPNKDEKKFYFYVSYKIMKDVIREHLESVDQASMVMRMDNLTLTLSPLLKNYITVQTTDKKTKKTESERITQGMHDLKTKVKSILDTAVDNGRADNDLYPRFFCVVRVSGEEYQGSSSEDTSPQSVYVSPNQTVNLSTRPMAQVLTYDGFNDVQDQQGSAGGMF